MRHDRPLPVVSIRRSAKLHRRCLPTVSVQLDDMAPVALGAWLEGRAKVLKVTRAMSFAQGLVTADSVPAARVSGVFKIGPSFADAAPPR